MSDDQIEEVYIGDGLYVSYDGYQIKLRAPRYMEDHEVYLDQDTFREFVRWLRKNKFIPDKDD